MNQNVCPQCGAPISAGVTECKYCGEVLSVSNPQTQGYTQEAVYQKVEQTATQNVVNNGINPYWPIKSKVAAGLLAIFLGGIGIHKFYLGKIGLGILYLLFCWTYIPAFVGFIEGIVILSSSDQNFQIKNQVRIV